MIEIWYTQSNFKTFLLPYYWKWGKGVCRILLKRGKYNKNAEKLCKFYVFSSFDNVWPYYKIMPLLLLSRGRRILKPISKPRFFTEFENRRLVRWWVRARAQLLSESWARAQEIQKLRSRSHNHPFLFFPSLEKIQ